VVDRDASDVHASGCAPVRRQALVIAQPRRGRVPRRERAGGARVDLDDGELVGVVRRQFVQHRVQLHTVAARG
jgi:hypothetical protein